MPFGIFSTDKYKKYAIQSESVTKTWPSTRMKSPFWASIVAWALFIYALSRLNAPRLAEPRIPRYHPSPKPPVGLSEVHGVFFPTSSFFGGSLCIVIDFRAGGEVLGLRAVCRIRLSFWPEENLLKTLSLGAWRGFPYSRPKEQRARVKVSERYFWVDLKDASELFTAQVHFAFVVLCVLYFFCIWYLYIFLGLLWDQKSCRWDRGNTFRMFLLFSVGGLLVVLGISSSLNWLFLYQAKTHTHIEVRYQTTIKVASIRRS